MISINKKFPILRYALNINLYSDLTLTSLIALRVKIILKQRDPVKIPPPFIIYRAKAHTSVYLKIINFP